MATETGLLAPYRVLDLTEGGFNMAAKLLADLGADVIRVEPPFGCQTRCRGPYFRDQVAPEQSLFWFAFNLNKRGMTLDYATPDGARILRRLLADVDVLFESRPTELDEAGFDDEALSCLNPGVIRVSITPFGPTGPYAGYRSADLIVWALSGYLHACGDPDRPPVRISVPISEQIAAASAAAGAMHAIHARRTTGRGQRVDVSQLSAAVWANSMLSVYGVTETAMTRQGGFRAQGDLRFQELFRCKDGYVSCFLMQGPWGAPFNRRLVAWMDEHGMAPQELLDLDWDQWSPTTMGVHNQQSRGAAEAAIAMVEKPVAAFLLTRTKTEILERALNDSLQIGPVMNTSEIADWDHLRDRQFWRTIRHDELGTSLRYPGPFAQFSESPIAYRCRAPRIGEHNREILVDELGYRDADLTVLQASGAI